MTRAVDAESEKYSHEPALLGKKYQPPSKELWAAVKKLSALVDSVDVSAPWAARPWIADDVGCVLRPGLETVG